MPNRFHVLALAQVANALLAGHPAPLLAQGASPAPPTGTVVVCAIDRSASYDFTTPGRRACAREILLAQAGDEVIVRFISDRSYRAEEVVTHLRLPAVAQCRNPFDLRCKAAEKRGRRVATQLRARALEELRRVPTAARATDIIGLLLAAEDHFDATPATARRKLVIASDLHDNVGQRILPNLLGVDVIIVALESDADVVAARALRNRWAAFLYRARARQVRFVPAEGGVA